MAASHPPDTTPVAPATTPAAQPQQRAAAPERYTPSPSAQRSQEMPPEVRNRLNEMLAKLEDALYDYDKSNIRPDATAALKDDVGVIRDILAAYPNQKLLIEGNCDERGSEEYNLALGERRAKTAEEFMASMGISNAQLTIVSLGKDHPVCTDQDEACWQRNRRAHITAAP
ncbi:MAG TPA: OmpA family protein [Bryobacteraceae bacterium]|nr:OmpA family protein [Bryobacteraceae bacterium]